MIQKQLLKPLLQIKDLSNFQPEQALNFEWLETNGLGGYASSTITGTNTRRYHGLMVIDSSPQEGRWVLLSKCEEDLIIDGERHCLSTNQYAPATVHPEGYQYIRSFELRPYPVWRFSVNGLEIQKSIIFVYGENTLLIEYEIIKCPKALTKASLQLELRPLIAFRNYHNTTHQNDFLNPKINQIQGQVSLKTYPDLPEIFISHQAAIVDPQGFWYKDFFYPQEQARGLDAQEDLFNPCVIKYDLTDVPATRLMVSLDAQDISHFEILKKKEIHRRQEIQDQGVSKGPLASRLALAADQFIITRHERKTVIAGYHWFSDWGRDTMIALPGLALATGRFKDAQDILLSFSKYVNQGMLPNRFSESVAPLEYNTVDAALWYFEAIRLYGQTTGHWDFIKVNFFDILQGIIDWYIKGTRYNIRMDVDGLIYGGQEGIQLTWMDAKVGDWVITPRQGKPVEIQALWFNALSFMAFLSDKFDKPDEAANYKNLAAKVKVSFNKTFWNENQKALYDVVNGTMKDDQIRPNQVLAMSLGFAVLEESSFKDVLSLIDAELLTPLGLRTLNKSNPAYKGNYQGNPQERDSAYHQGTIWPWLLGPYIKAYLRAYGKNAKTIKRVKEILKPIEESLDIYGLGQIGEIFDGNPPHAPKGCIAQAWSVAQILEALDL